LAKLVEKASGRAGGVQAGEEVVGAEVAVVDVVAEDVPDGDEDAVSYRYQRTFAASAGGQAPVSGDEVVVLGAG
jgi:hypothetical protein